jgi:hypothetical protein
MSVVERTSEPVKDFYRRTHNHGAAHVFWWLWRRQARVAPAAHVFDARWVSVNFMESSTGLRPPPKPRSGHEASGAGFRRGYSRPERRHYAPFAPESQSFPDHLVAGIRPNRSWSDRLFSRRLIPPFPGSNPGDPASHRGLTLGISGTHGSADISGGLAARSPVSGEEFRRILAEGRESRGKSLIDDFSISEIWIGSRPETGCVSAETGSNSALRQRLQDDSLSAPLSVRQPQSRGFAFRWGACRAPKDSKKYATSGGWGFGQFTNGKPDDEAVHKTCFSCHQPAKGQRSRRAPAGGRHGLPSGERAAGARQPGLKAGGVKRTVKIGQASMYRVLTAGN